MVKSDAELRLALVGASIRGVAMSQCMAEHAPVRVVGVADPSAAALDRARKRFGAEGIVYASSDAELYRQVESDAVLIASGDPYHVENAEQALAHGRDVFLEKPVAQDMDGLRRLMRAWNASGSVLMAGLELRQCVVFVEMKRLLDAGAIGRVIMAHAMDNVSVGGKYFFHNQYRHRSYVRSLVLQKGTHTIDLLNWFVDARPRRVFCLSGQNVYGKTEPDTRRCRACEKAGACRHAVRNRQTRTDFGEIQKLDDLCVFAKGADVDDNSMVLIDYDNGARAYYGECHFTPEYTREFTLIGDQGKMTGFYNNECEFKIEVIRNDSPRDTRVVRPRPTLTSDGHGGSDALAMIEFVRRVRARDRAAAEFHQVLDGTAIAIAATDSAEQGMPVAIPDWRTT